MSQPTIMDSLYQVAIELGSARSSLHMYPEEKEDREPNALFLDEIDEWAHHATIHINGATRCLHEFERTLPDKIRKVLDDNGIPKEKQKYIIRELIQKLFK